MADLNGIKCPFCGNENIVLAIGGTKLKPTDWDKENLKYICTNENCLLEFGDNGITELDSPKDRIYENIL